MAGLYDEQILGAKKRAETARKLREESMGQAPQGQMIGRYYVSPHWTQALAHGIRQYMLGSQEREATQEAEDLQRQQAQSTIQALNQAGMSAPETLLKSAQSPVEQPGFMDKAVAFLRGEEMPQAPVPTPIQQNIAKDLTPEQKHNAMIQMLAVNPELGKQMIDMDLAKQKAEELKAEREANRQYREDVYYSTHGVKPGEAGAVVGGRIIRGDGQVETLPKVGSASGVSGSVTGVGSSSAAAWKGAVKSGDIVQAYNDQGQPVFLNKRTMQVVQPPEEIQGFGKPKTSSEEKPLTESQANAQLYSERMKEADKTLEDIGTDYSPAGVNVAKSIENVPLVGWAANAALSDKSQQAGQAQRNFLNAVLRKESGAAISPSEFSNAQRQYFPQPGDSEAVIAQKKQNRLTAQKQIAAAVPKKSQPADTDVSIDDLLKQYGGK